MSNNRDPNANHRDQESDEAEIINEESPPARRRRAAKVPQDDGYETDEGEDKNMPNVGPPAHDEAMQEQNAVFNTVEKGKRNSNIGKQNQLAASAGIAD